jgi:hypothetical protein
MIEDSQTLKKTPLTEVFPLLGVFKCSSDKTNANEEALIKKNEESDEEGHAGMTE